MADVLIPPRRPPSAMRIAPMDRHIGARIRALRVERGLTQKMLADASGVSHGQIDKYERGANAISPGRLHAIARVLNVVPGWFYLEFPGDAAAAYETAPQINEDPETARALKLAQDVLALPAQKRHLVRALIRHLSPQEGVEGDDASDADEAAMQGVTQ